MQLKWALFKGISLTSKLIKFWTRSEYSHVGFLLNECVLIECWGASSPFDVKWGFSIPPFSKHRKNTHVEIWCLDVSKQEFEFVTGFMLRLAQLEYKYDWLGVIGFVLKVDKHNRSGFFCSEGCIYPLVKAKGWKSIKPHHVSPAEFVNIIEAAGAKLEKSFVL